MTLHLFLIIWHTVEVALSHCWTAFRVVHHYPRPPIPECQGPHGASCLTGVGPGL
jgi:hypothetical protein